MCDAETLDQCDRVIFKTEEELQDEKNNANILNMKEVFIPLNTCDSKDYECQRTKSKIFDEDYLMFDVLKAFKLV